MSTDIRKLGTDAPHDAIEEVAHGGPPVYTANLVALLILTGLTIAASYVDLGSGSGNVAVALAIASMKALLVALFFMHLRWDRRVNAIIAMAGFLFLGIFLGFDLLDANTRRDPSPHVDPVQMSAEEATPVPDTTNPLLAPAPKPLTAVAEAEEETEAAEATEAETRRGERSEEEEGMTKSKE